MEDHVADVLAQRAALERGRLPAVLFTVLLHGAIAAAIVWAARRAPAIERVPVITIKFAAASPSIQSAPSRTAKTPAKPAAVTPPPPRIEQPAVEPVKPAPMKPSANTVPLSPFGRSTKPGEEKAAPPSLPPVSVPATGTGTPGVTATLPAIGSSGVTGLEGTFPFPFYIERMNTLIAGKWFRPPAKGDFLTAVYFTIHRDGSIRDARIEGSSGNATFDRAALRAVIEASPLPPLPFGYSGTYLGVHLTFH
jgi:periplasmic protein TonB